MDNELKYSHSQHSGGANTTKPTERKETSLSVNLDKSFICVSCTQKSTVTIRSRETSFHVLTVRPRE